MAVRLWTPLVAVVVSHEAAYGATVTSAPRFAPSSLNCTPTMPTVSMALAETVIVPATVAPGVAEQMEMGGGGVVSAKEESGSPVTTPAVAVGGGSRSPPRFVSPQAPLLLRLYRPW